MAFNFRLRKCINFSKFSKAGNTEIIPLLTSRLLRVDASESVSRKRSLIGKIVPIYQGIPDSISYKIYSGSQLILLPEIGMYSLRFVSSGQMRFGSVRFFEKIGQLSDTELRIVQSLLGMVAEMASADTRNLIQSIEATSATIAADKATQDVTNASNSAAIAAAQAAADTANSGVAAVNAVAAQITDEMVTNEPFTIPVTAFVLQASGLYHAVLDLIKVDGSKGVQMSLTDNDGDEQGFSQLITRYGGNTQKVAVELSANQKNDNSYPLSLLCQGRKLAVVGGTSPVAPVSTNFKQLGVRPHWYQLAGETVDHSTDGVTIATPMVGLNVLSGYMLTSLGLVYLATNDGNHYYFDGTTPTSTWNWITQNVFDSTAGFPDRVAL